MRCQKHFNVDAGGYCAICLMDEIDTLRTKNKELEDALETIEQMYNALKPVNASLRQENERLRGALESVWDWLETSSLQQVLVHNCKDSNAGTIDALIMGVASHLTRIEAALGQPEGKK